MTQEKNDNFLIFRYLSSSNTVRCLSWSWCWEVRQTWLSWLDLGNKMTNPYSRNRQHLESWIKTSWYLMNWENSKYSFFRSGYGWERRRTNNCKNHKRIEFHLTSHYQRKSIPKNAWNYSKNLKSPEGPSSIPMRRSPWNTDRYLASPPIIWATWRTQTTEIPKLAIKATKVHKQAKVPMNGRAQATAHVRETDARIAPRNIRRKLSWSLKS